MSIFYSHNKSYYPNLQMKKLRVRDAVQASPSWPTPFFTTSVQIQFYAGSCLSASWLLSFIVIESIRTGRFQPFSDHHRCTISTGFLGLDHRGTHILLFDNTKHSSSSSWWAPGSPAISFFWSCRNAVHEVCGLIGAGHRASLNVWLGSLKIWTNSLSSLAASTWW